MKAKKNAKAGGRSATQPRRSKMAYKFAYINNTGKDTREFHPVILKAIANGGKFDEDFADIFSLTKTPEGSAAEYSLDFA